ncbi:MAG TPA: cell division protein FtsH, partial [Thermomicrobiales bacterium]|nr:cell division protein FtsH [Thermomicrobiales bacterium]
MTDNKWLRNGFVWIILIIAVIALWFMVTSGGERTQSRDLSSIAADIRSGQVARLEQSEDSSKVMVFYKGSDQVETFRLPPNVNIYDALLQYGVEPSDVDINIKAASQWGNWLGLLTFILPTVILIGIVVFMMRQAQGSNSQAMSFGKS